MAENEPTTVRHRVGKCPACRDYLWADVSLLVSIGTPTLDERGKATVYASAYPVAMKLDHECDSREELMPWEAEILRADA